MKKRLKGAFFIRNEGLSALVVIITIVIIVVITIIVAIIPVIAIITIIFVIAVVTVIVLVVITVIIMACLARCLLTIVIIIIAIKMAVQHPAIARIHPDFMTTPIRRNDIHFILASFLLEIDIHDLASNMRFGCIGCLRSIDPRLGCHASRRQRHSHSKKMLFIQHDELLYRDRSVT